ncbi:MAG: ABC transporter ATP-binding protein [Candidatus Accumulibacter sp. UW26]|jgi:NitT/TauT family transport system ATP-binding protein
MQGSLGLKLEGVGFAYQATPVLQDINISIPQGQLVSLLGASGSGKTTLLRLAAGLDPVACGRLSWNGVTVAGPSLKRGVVFQDYALFPWLSVVDNIEIAIAKARPTVRRAERLAEARKYLGDLGLEAAIGKYPGELSGGMRQRAAIARALALGSPLLLMDEPFGALDPVNRARLQDLLLEVWELSTPRKTIVFVTHDVDEAIYLGDRLIVLGSAPGRVIANLQVPLTRPRERRKLLDSLPLQALREEVAATLVQDTLQRLKAA